MDILGTRRVQWMIDIVCDSLGLPFNYVEVLLFFNVKQDHLNSDRNREILTEFLNGRGPPKLFVYHQQMDGTSSDESHDMNNTEVELFLTFGDTESLKAKAVYFLYNVRDQGAHKRTVNLSEQSDNDITFGEITPESLMWQLSIMLEEVYTPYLKQLKDEDWGQCEVATRVEFQNMADKFMKDVIDSSQLMAQAEDIYRFTDEELTNIQSISQPEKNQYYERKMNEWMSDISNQLAKDGDLRKDLPDAGPHTELEYWRARMQRIINWSENLKNKDFQQIKVALHKQSQHEASGKRTDENISKLFRDYNKLELLLADKLNEAKDNVKYLATLEQYLEPLYRGTPEDIINGLPALINAIKMIHTIARFYNTTDKMTGLFMKITNQMIKNCKALLLGKSLDELGATISGTGALRRDIDEIWKRDPTELIGCLARCVDIYRAYKKYYNDAKDKTSDTPKGKTFDFSESQIFGKFDAFVRRIQKLIDIFANIQQLQALEKHNLEDMDKLTMKFNAIVENFKRKRHDLLDTSNNKFDKDWLEFNVEISKLDAELQAFIDSNFTRFRNIEYSLKLLRKFESTIKRDSLKHNLITKYNSILHNYATELDGIQKTFKEQKMNPPLIRNVPPDAGKIVWSRHLYQKITRPIFMFPQHVINSNEIKKYYGAYNNLARQLTMYEMWYFQNWSNDIDRSKAALQSTLIVRHDQNKKLYVNFDLQIMQLIREAKCLDRQGIEIPENAHIILLQADKFKKFYNELLYALKEYERIISLIKPVCNELLAPHVEDLELKLRPGMVTLTWTSMNIEPYLQHVHRSLKKLEQLILSVNDIIENRLETNLKAVAKIILVKLPENTKPLTLDSFVELQEEFIAEKTEYLISKNIEIERAADDLFTLILSYDLDEHVQPVTQEEVQNKKGFYCWYFYQALLRATQNSLNAMKHRVCGKRVPGQTEDELKPFFELDVQLTGPEVSLNPSLDSIQRAINKAATAVLRCSRKLYRWDQMDREEGARVTFYDWIAKDKEIVKVILLLTGSIQGARNKVNEFLGQFSEYDWLCKRSIAEDIKEFVKKNPTLQDYEDILRKFTNYEEEIDKGTDHHQIGAMELKTSKIRASLKIWSKEWKLQYSQELHKNARAQLDSLTELTKLLQGKLNKEVKDIDSLGYVMETLQQIRKEQAEIDMKFTPVIEMYSLLDNYLQGGITDKDEMDARSVLRRNWETLVQQAEIKGKELQEKQGEFLIQLKTNIREFVKDVQEFRRDYEENGPMVEGIQPNDAMERLRRFEDEFDVKDKFFLINRRGENLFGLQKQQYPELEKTRAEIANLKKLYDLYETVNKSMSAFRERAWQDVTKDELLQIAESAQKYGDMCLRLPKDLKEWRAYNDLKQKIDNLKEVLPLITDLKKPSIMERHWIKINEITGANLNYQNPDQMQIQDLINANLLTFMEDIIDITESADKQLRIRQQLDEISQFWDTAEFEFQVWGRREYPCMLGGLKVSEILDRLDEDQMTLATLNAQRHVTPFKVEVEHKIRTFSDVNDALDLWVKVQKLWTSLEPVFTGGDIARQMPLQAKQFQGIDKNWMKIMEKSVETKRVIPCCQNDMLKDFLPDLNQKLEECQKMLEAYLEGKRKKFPRFYFVSNPTLLKILSQGSDPTSIQEDFEKLFDAITKVTFEKSPDKKATQEKIITAFQQVMGRDEENVPLNYIVKCEGNIETWLQTLEKNMQQTIKDIARAAAVSVFQTPLKEFCRGQISQIALLGLQILWTAKVMEGLERVSRNEKNAMEQKRREIQEMMTTLSSMCLEEMPTSVERTKVETLVTIQVHQKDIAYELKCKDVSDFDWQKQTRMLWKQDIDDCLVQITDWEEAYCYEFLGAKERLCITPLTDRCYITLAQAFSMYYGGSPAGPAGTGKTETVKDLGRTLGVFVVVTNCSDQHRYRDMAKIFKGLCQSGLWGCFDEFNRIELEVLSVVAMQVESIGTAKKLHAKEFTFPEEENPIQLTQSVQYCITMNPGYAGRQELPENLKVLFRGVSMMVPDREIIIKVKLASVGYTSIEILAKKFNVLYRLCEEQLSKQRHYDFGLRNILSVLRTAGFTKRQELTADEEMILMRSLRDMNLSKLVADDIPLFNGLLLDIFPRQTSVPKMNYPDVENKIPEIISGKVGNVGKGCLVSIPSFVLKVIQVYETYRVRHGFMLVGPTCSGKTTIMNILTETLTSLGMPHRITRMNPKAITAEEMYGVKSEISDDWIPGVFSTIWQKSNNRALKHSTWITCDGPVDAIWIENLNTVLDDNKILTLANGERIAMTENCRVVFEVENLNNASPATVSRCGQVYVSPTDLGYEAILQGWLLGRKQAGRGDESEKIGRIMEKYVIEMRIIEALEKVVKEPVIALSPVMKLINALNLLTGLLQPFTATSKVVSEADLEKFVLFSLAWANGGICEANDRSAVHEFLWSKGLPIPQKDDETITLFDYYLDIESCDWRKIKPEDWQPPEGHKTVQFSSLLLPTLDTFKAEMIMNAILSQPKSSLCLNAVLLVGGSGTAKTSSVLMYADKFDKTQMLFKRTNFSSATAPHMFQQTVETECDFKVGKDFAPPQNKLMTLFIDDMSMPFVNKWGDQITLELARQLIEQGGFYMLDKTQRGFIKNIKNLFYVGAMNHPGGGRNDIPNRLKQKFFVFNMILPLSIESIYGQIIRYTFKQKYFSAETYNVVENLCGATIQLWNKVKSTMLPTPSKFHYVFNMRELSRIFKGILATRRDVITQSSAIGTHTIKPELFLVGLWRHECERTFVDKLVSNKDKQTVLSYIQEVSLDAFSQLENEILEQFTSEKSFLFCDFLREDQRNEDGIIEVEAEKIYEAINSLPKLRQRCESCLKDYNAKYTSRRMDLVLFDDALRHLLRISRIIRAPRSSGLLVGVGGSGKQSLVRLGADIGRNLCYQIVVTKNYAEKDLKDDLKACFDISGHQGKQLTFLMTDSEVKKESFLEYINMILSTGEIPGLLAKDEREVWLTDLSTEYQKELGSPQEDPTQAQLWQYFVDRIRNNFHIILCFSPVGQKFRERARKFPALFNECTIDWFLPWPEEALVSVASTFISKFSELDTKSEVRGELIKHMGNVHLMVSSVCDLYFQRMRRQVYVTPKSFLSMINSYKQLYIQKYSQLDKQAESYKQGLAKIQEASEAIAIMEVGLKEEEAQLQEATQKTDHLLADLEAEGLKVKAKSDQVQETTRQCEEQKKMIEREHAEAEKDLQAAMPALVRAQQAVDTLDPKDIVELKTNKQPLDIIKYIIDTITVFFQGKLMPIQLDDQRQVNKKQITFLKDSYEEGGRLILSDINFMKRLREFEKDQISEEVIELLEPYLAQQGDWFTEENGRKASKAAAGILRWVLAMYEYHGKARIVKPKKIFLAVQQGRLEVAERELEEAKVELKKIQAIEKELQERYDKQKGEKDDLEQKALKTKKRIGTARGLITSLAGERKRWEDGAQEIAEQKRKLVGNACLATSFISYCGAFNAEYRKMLAQEYFIADMKKRGIPLNANLELTQFLIDDATIGEWNLQGLPKDDLSIQNGIMVTNSTRYPIFIDPQLQGYNWIKNKYADSIDPHHSIVSLNHPKFKDNYLKFCLEEGKTLIIENIENEVDTILDPVLEKQVQVKGKTRFLDISGTQMDFHQDFKLFLTCRLPNPLFSPELSAKATIIDFTVTQTGLDQQLLGRVISKEQKALEDSLNTLLSDVNACKKSLQRLDATLLERLTESTGNLLDDLELIEVLNNTKKQSKEVSQKLQESEVKTKEINEKREQYRSVAVRGSALYFTMIEVSEINWMYNSSLAQFLGLFMGAIDMSEKAQLPSKRVENIVAFLTYHVYKYVNRGLFESDKVSFVLMMCFKIMTTAKKINGEDVSIFLKGGASLDLRAERAKPVPFISDKAWLNALALSRHHFSGESLIFFRELPDSFVRNEAAWKQWIERNDPENYTIPDFAERIAAEKEIGSFLAFCLVRALREDRTVVASQIFISTMFGTRFTDPISYPIDEIYQETTSGDPVLFLLSAGADPTSSIDELARKKKKFPCEKVSMGEGQEIVARKAIFQGFDNGGWVILQNCHLGINFMDELESIFSPSQQIHEDFRLWITCEQRNNFPLGLLQKAIKVTNEPPKGLKAGLNKTFTTIISQEFLDRVDHPNWRSLIFTICFLHSIVIERRKFGPLGWCIPYEFNYSDLEASLLFVEKYLSNLLSVSVANMPNLPISMNVIRYMICEVQYGGRVTDDLDRELFVAYGEDYFKEGIFSGEYVFVETVNELASGARERFKYKIPANPQNELTKYHEYIMVVPQVDNPEIFGLHANADLTFRLKESTEMINTIMNTRPKEGDTGAGRTREEIVQDKARELLAKLPPDYVDADVREQVRKLPGPKQLADKGFQVPMNIFLYQEIQRMLRIIVITRKTLTDVIDAIDGQIIMTPEILEAIDAIFDAKVPKLWLYDPSGAEISWMLPTIGSWFNSLIERNKQLNDWMRNNRPQTFWLTGFFNPQGFLTAMKQEVTRMHKRSEKAADAWSLDDVIYSTQVKEKEYEMIRDVQPEGCYIHGLFLEGGRWSKNGLEEAEPKKMFSPLPILYVTAINKKKSADPERLSNTYSCPVYKYRSRNDKYLIFRVGLPCEGSGPHKWKLRGIALLCSTEWSIYITHNKYPSLTPGNDSGTDIKWNTKPHLATVYK